MEEREYGVHDNIFASSDNLNQNPNTTITIDTTVDGKRYHQEIPCKYFVGVAETHDDMLRHIQGGTSSDQDIGKAIAGLWCEYLTHINPLIALELIKMINEVGKKAVINRVAEDLQKSFGGVDNG